MGKKVIMIYNLGGKDIERINLNRRLFQYPIKSHKGKYQSKTDGVLKRFKKPVRSVVIFDKRDLPAVKRVIKNSKAKYKIYEISKEIK